MSALYLLVNGCNRGGDYGLIIKALFLRMRGGAFVFLPEGNEMIGYIVIGNQNRHVAFR